MQHRGEPELISEVGYVFFRGLHEIFHCVNGRNQFGNNELPSDFVVDIPLCLLFCIVSTLPYYEIKCELSAFIHWPVQRNYC